jgi:class 3 adenylate cyclase
LPFGALLRRHRLLAGLTQETLAERAGLSTRAISDLERGLSRTPQSGTLDLLAEALQLRLEERADFVAAARRAALSEPLDPPSSPAVQMFLIADVRGYTRFTQEQGDEAAARLASRFAAMVRASAEASGRRLLELRGDEALVVFDSARQALRTALELQARFAQEAQNDPTLPLPVGIGLDAGEAVPAEGCYRGGALNLAARLCSLAGPGEVLASETVTNLARKVAGVAYSKRGQAQLKGFVEPVTIIQALPDGEAAAARETRQGREGASQEPAETDTSQEPLPIGGFLGALPDGVLVGRDEEQRQVVAAINAVTGGTGRLVCLVGEPGIGKTRLAQEVALLARNRGFLVATGRCYAPQQTVPYYPFLEALATAYQAAAPAIKAELPKRWPDVTRLLPQYSLSLSPARDGGSTQDEQQRPGDLASAGAVLSLAWAGHVGQRQRAGGTASLQRSAPEARSGRAVSAGGSCPAAVARWTESRVVDGRFLSPHALCAAVSSGLAPCTPVPLATKAAAGSS